MVRLCLLAASVAGALAGCPKRGGDAPVAAPAPVAGAGCPAASNVYMASYLTPEAGTEGHTGWVLPLFDEVASTADKPAYGAIDAAAARAAGVPAPPPSVWLLLPNAAPCKATIGSHYVAAVDDGTPNLAYGVELTGCAAPTVEDASAIALVSDQPPTGCTAVAPRPVAERLGDDQDGVWQRPTTSTPIPDAFAATMPAKPCAAPGCEQLWSIAQVDIGGRPVAWAGAVNWLTIPDGAAPATQCEWKAETYSGFFVAGPDGNAVKVTAGQDHPLALVAVLADREGAKVAVAAGPGEYTTYDLAGGAAQVGRHLVWLIPHPESFTQVDVLGPYCGT